MTGRLGAYLREAWDEDYAPGFGLSVVTEQGSDRDGFVDALGRLVAEHKADPEVVRDLVDVAGWQTAVAPLLQGRASVRRGDVGEVLAAEAIEVFDDRIVPVRKLRYQIDPNRTLPGADVVALDLDETRELAGIAFGECKYRTRPALDIMLEAHDQLREDSETRFATTINFIAHRLKEIDSDLYAQFLRFLATRGDEEATYYVTLACDTTRWREKIADELEETDPMLDPLIARAIVIDDILELIEAACQAQTLDLLPDDD